MLLYEMQVTKTAIYRIAPAKIPWGITGAKVKLSFSPEWEGLRKTVVFRAGRVVKDILDVEDVAVIPVECTQKTGELLEIGVYGTDAKNTVAIPTLWGPVGRIVVGTVPSGDTSTSPDLPVWAQLLDMVKELEEQGVTQNEVDQAVKDYFRKNPITAQSLGAADAGLVESEITVTAATDDVTDTDEKNRMIDNALMAEINAVYNSMANGTAKFITVVCDGHPRLGGATYLVKIYRHQANYGYMEASAYNGVTHKRYKDGSSGWSGWKEAFAPTGYGLGMSAISVNDLNETVDCGFFAWGSDCANAPFSYGMGITINRYGTERSQILFNPWMDGKGQIATRHYSSGAWRNVEYLNPPMMPGVEYLTTERSEGKPVYAKRITYTVAEAIAGSVAQADIEIPHGVSNLGKCVRVNATYGNYPLPHIPSNGTYLSVYYVGNTYITVRAIKKPISTDVSFVLDFYYTKTE